jgi:hypothetical protein
MVMTMMGEVGRPHKSLVYQKKVARARFKAGCGAGVSCDVRSLSKRSPSRGIQLAKELSFLCYLARLPSSLSYLNGLRHG